MLMGQVTIYLDEETERKMMIAAKSAQLSKSKWIAGVIQDKVISEWPRSVAELAGSWQDLPSLEEIRAGSGDDGNRERL